MQKAKIKAVQDKIDLIKANIDEEVLKREQKIAETTKEQMMRMKALKERLANIEQQKQETSQRMANMKFLSETILQQRNDVEQFFIMTLEACKRQANEEEGKGIIAETRPYG